MAGWRRRTRGSFRARLRPEPRLSRCRIAAPPGSSSSTTCSPAIPTQLGPFRCSHRLKPDTEPVNADKPTPLLGTAAEPTADSAAPAFVVIKVLTGNPTADGQIRLREEQILVRAAGRAQRHAP